MGQRVFTTPLIITTEDKARAAVIKEAEEKARAAKTPAFIRDGLGACASAANADDFTDDTRRPSGVAARTRASVLCRICPFSGECLPWAKRSGQDGVFGGVWLRKGKEVE